MPRHSFFALLIAAVACGGPTIRDRGSESPEAGSVSDAAVDQSTCEQWGVGGEWTPLSRRPVCTQAAEEQREFDRRQADREYEATERARESAEEDAGVRLELEGKALAGDGKHLGQGWHCFRGEKDGDVRGRCHRDLFECGLLLAEHQQKGFATEMQRCDEYAQAACFQATRSAKEGPRVFCFPDEALCARGYESVAHLDGVETIECATYR